MLISEPLIRAGYTSYMPPYLFPEILFEVLPVYQLICLGFARLLHWVPLMMPGNSPSKCQV